MTPLYLTNLHTLNISGIHHIRKKNLDLNEPNPFHSDKTSHFLRITPPAGSTLTATPHRKQSGSWFHSVSFACQLFIQVLCVQLRFAFPSVKTRPRFAFFTFIFFFVFPCPTTSLKPPWVLVFGQAKALIGLRLRKVRCCRRQLRFCASSGCAFCFCRKCRVCFWTLPLGGLRRGEKGALKCCSVPHGTGEAEDEAKPASGRVCECEFSWVFVVC